MMAQFGAAARGRRGTEARETCRPGSPSPLLATTRGGEHNQSVCRLGSALRKGQRHGDCLGASAGPSSWVLTARTDHAMSLSPNLPPDKQREMLRRMLTIRRFEERASADYLAGKIYGVVHCYIGEEAVAVGVCSALDHGDRIISTHRGHGHCIAKGADLNRMMAELYGRQTGYCKGKGGSMHIADFGIGMLGANGIVAGGIAIVTGAGLAAQLEGKGGVAVSFFGDGASNAGPFHECLNIAATWKLPMLYVCENNLYAAQTAAAATHALRDVAARAAGYGIPGVVVDGNDIFAVHQAANRAVERARAGEGPTLIECKTYRWRAHTERRGQPDPRDQAEREGWMRRDPIAQLERQLRAQEYLDDSGLAAIESDVSAALEAAVAFAEASPFPTAEQATDDVFAA
jgi:acetoin:2,6-dichlorophenolindophenol oxidoreductase subunit alpha